MNITKEDIHNLLVFLSRVQLTGSEAVTYVMLCEKIKLLAKDEVKDDAIQGTAPG